MSRPTSYIDQLAPQEAGAFLGQRCVTLRVSVKQQFMGKVPGGYRVDFYYSGESEEKNGKGAGGAGKTTPFMSADDTWEEPLRAAINDGRIVSGADWVTINSRTVLDFDSRITLALRTPIKKLECPVVGRLRGRVRLRDARKDNEPYFSEGASDEEVFAVWHDGFEEDSWLPLVLSAAFEVPTFGFSEEQNRTYEHARVLGDFLYLGLGRASFRKARYGAVKSIQLSLSKLSAGEAVAADGKRAANPEQPVAKDAGAQK